MICPHCGKEINQKQTGNKEIYDRFLQEWNDCGMIQHRKVTTRMKKTIDKVIKNADYPLTEIFTAFKNYGSILNSPMYVWSYKWTMEDFLNRGLYKFVDEAQPFANNKKGCDLNHKPKNPFENFDCS